jgi:hypothetical protein
MKFPASASGFQRSVDLMLEHVHDQEWLQC